MTFLNRALSPKYKTLENIELKDLSSFKLTNGADVYFLNTPNTGVLKIDFVYNAGQLNQLLPGQASATGAMLTEGTKLFSAKVLADSLDQYGSYLNAKTNVDDATLSLYCLPKHLNSCLGYVLAVISDCTFPEKELNTYKTNAIQRFKINNQRNSFMGRRTFYESIFGKENAYGSSVYQNDYELISRETVVAFYEETILPGFKYMLVSGDVSGFVLKEIDSCLGLLGNKPALPKSLVLSPSSPQNIVVENDHSIQSNIRIGRSFVNRGHPDFNKLQLLTLTLGGYFGSRLMKNLREEKGLTYGIYSAMESYWNGGVFYIETEINNDLREVGKNEILKELAILRDVPISKTELLLVKNYMLGSFLRGLDGPFSLVDRFKTLIDYGLTNNYYQNFVDTIKSTTADDLQRLANIYLQEGSLTTVITGKKQNV